MIFDFFLNVLFPPVCAGCRRMGRQICLSCKSELIPAQSICPGCQFPIDDTVLHVGCRERTALDEIVGIYVYKGVIRKMLKQSKYQFLYPTLRELTQNTPQSIISNLKNKEAVIVPIPLHPTRQKWRGFNQAQIIGQVLAAETGLPLTALLWRTKETKPQAQILSRSERSQNIKNAFSLNQEKTITPKVVILVDDVFTSGATMNEAARVLKQSGVKKVIGFALMQGERKKLANSIL